MDADLRRRFSPGFVAWSPWPRRCPSGAVAASGCGMTRGIRERAHEPDPVETDIDTADPDHGGIGFPGAGLGRGDPLSLIPPPCTR